MQINVGDAVYNRNWSETWIGTVARIDEGCNPVYWVDFGKEFLSCVCSLDIRRTNQPLTSPAFLESEKWIDKFHRLKH